EAEEEEAEEEEAEEEEAEEEEAEEEEAEEEEAEEEEAEEESMTGFGLAELSEDALDVDLFEPETAEEAPEEEEGEEEGEEEDGTTDEPVEEDNMLASDPDDGLDDADNFDTFEIGFEEDGDRFILNEWIILTDEVALTGLSQTGFDLRDIEPLGELERVLIRAVSPDGMSLPAAQAIILEIAPQALIAHNHIYGTDQAASYGRMPQDLLRFGPASLTAAPKIGVIDTAIALDHPSLSAARIQTQDFVTYPGLNRPQSHGTSIVSILVGQDENYTGLLPGAEVFAASAFFDTTRSGDMATTFGLVQAIDWMMENQVQVINFSLTGPENPILREAISRARNAGIHAVAAIGNDGPVAPPLYPAAYDEVIGVTAVNRRMQVYRLAGHGQHVDFAAPGVLITHARAGGAYTTSSGTSLAAPFVSAALAVLIELGVEPEAAVAQLQSGAEDLGADGFDTIFGHGFIKLPD
uniref:S8 family serine peptidase n=1 Tax=Maricaulis sp. TaxID=1486257 RepID=UPI002620A8B6